MNILSKAEAVAAQQQRISDCIVSLVGHLTKLTGNLGIEVYGADERTEEKVGEGTVGAYLASAAYNADNIEKRLLALCKILDTDILASPTTSGSLKYTGSSVAAEDLPRFLKSDQLRNAAIDAVARDLGVEQR